MLLRLQSRIDSASSFSLSRNQPRNATASSASNSSHLQLRFHPTNERIFLRSEKCPVISCKSSHGGSRSWNRDADEYLQAFVLTSETIRHYYLRKQGFLEGTAWHSSSRSIPNLFHSHEPKNQISSVGPGFLRHFKSPTIFLKIACDGDLLLPIIVGEFAVEKLIEALREDDNGGLLNHFKFMKNLVVSLGYEVKMVRLTERVENTYYARVYLGKPGEDAITSIDARPSDAINIAERCKAPIYVNKNIVSSDAIKIAYGKWRGNNLKSSYDVSLDSAAEGPDKIAEELDLIIKMNLAASEGRYTDAAMWRDKLTKLRMS